MCLEEPAGIAYRYDLGVSGRIVVGDNQVESFADDLTATGYNSPKRAAVLEADLGQVNSFVDWVH